MSIASEISRLQGAKADLKTAIEGKGVTVSDATKLDGYADLVDAIQQGGGGSTLITKNISTNGTYNASSDSADGYSQVTVAVPASAVDTGTKNITANGSNQDVVGYAAVDVAVPNSYSASDEGKVVSNGALVAQTAHADVTPTTSDQTIDTTTNDSIKVKGDADLVASNIKKDVEIFGVTGSYEGGGGGMQISPLGYSFILQNGTAGAKSCGYLSYSSTCIFQPEGGGSITANGSVTKNNMATDGEHVWIRINNYTGSIKYNGVALDYVRDGNYFMVPIPAGFDGTIPFVIAG